MNRYFVVYKPYQVLSQFTQDVPNQRTLKDLDFDFPPDVYPVGRLDADSEGMLLLSNDKSLVNKMLNPKFQHPRTYWAQVERVPQASDLEQLRNGVSIKVESGAYQTLPARIELIDETLTEWLPDRNPPIRFRANIPTAWVQLQLIEGKNRQVRKMTAAVGFPTLRLVRVAMGNIRLHDWATESGQVVELPASIIPQLFVK